MERVKLTPHQIPNSIVHVVAAAFLGDLFGGFPGVACCASATEEELGARFIGAHETRSFQVLATAAVAGRYGVVDVKRGQVGVCGGHGWWVVTDAIMQEPSLAQPCRVTVLHPSAPSRCSSCRWSA